MTLDQEKIEARLKAKAVRKALGDDFTSRGAALQLIQWAKDLNEMAAGGVIAGYYPKGSEIDIRPLLDALRGLGSSIALPVMTGPERPMIFRLWTSDQDLQAGPFGIREPGPEAPTVRPSLVLTPMLAFDRQGMRLGYGGGYYDRTLESLMGETQVLVAGVAYAAQEVAHVPHDTHDHALNVVVTETEMIRL
jgi:5-formyltetrahydrofolate cyclo-ligase